MNKVQRVSSLRASVAAARADNKAIGFVPTMGNLHLGHLELVKVARRRVDFVVVSIYVNPTQFGKNEDLSNYPSTLDEDARLLAEMGADLLFLPSQETMYPGDLEQQTVVYVPEISDLYCGMDRPEHFYGVTTVVSRLFNMVQPDVAVFGKKDYQQLSILRRMAIDLAYPIQIVGVNTVRSESGLALSSRNGYLNAKELLVAPNLYNALQTMAATIKEQGFTNKSLLAMQDEAQQSLREFGFEPQYITVCRQSDLTPAKEGDSELVILSAAVLGQARLIDNIDFSVGQQAGD